VSDRAEPWGLDRTTPGNTLYRHALLKIQADISRHFHWENPDK